MIEVELPTSLSEAALERFERARAHRGVAAVRSFLAPASVAVIGASRRRGTVGGEILHNLIARRLRRAASTRSTRSADVVQGRRAYASVGDAARAGRARGDRGPRRRVVEAAARECGAAGVRALVVISAGFAEAGAGGRRAPARAARGLPRRRHAAGRAELPRRAQHRARRARCNATFMPARRRRRGASASSRRAAGSGSR